MRNTLNEDFAIISADREIKKLAGSNVFITGATGLIGSLMIKSLLYFNKKEEEKQKIHVIGLIRNKKKALEVFGKYINDPYLDIIEGDIKRRINIENKIDFIVHTASATTSKFFVECPVETIDISYQGTKNVLELAREKKSKGMVYLSSMEMYGRPNENLKKVTEADLGYIDVLNIRSSYSEGKRISECMCAAYADEYGVPVRIARLAQTFGAGVQKSDNRVYAQFARSAIYGENIVLHTPGKSYGNYCYTSDVIRAIALLLHSGNSGEAYNICNEETTRTIADMAEMVAREFGNGKLEVVFDIPEDTKMYGYAPDVKMYLCSEKLRKLGWKPHYSLKEMYQRMIEDIKEKGMKKSL